MYLNPTSDFLSLVDDAIDTSSAISLATLSGEIERLCASSNVDFHPVPCDMVAAHFGLSSGCNHIHNADELRSLPSGKTSTKTAKSASSVKRETKLAAAKRVVAAAAGTDEAPVKEEFAELVFLPDAPPPLPIDDDEVEEVEEEVEVEELVEEEVEAQEPDALVESDAVKKPAKKVVVKKVIKKLVAKKKKK